MTLPAEEILRVLFHDLPGGFVRICHFGFLANRGHTAKLGQCPRCRPPGVGRVSLGSPPRGARRNEGVRLPRFPRVSRTGEVAPLALDIFPY